MNEKQDNTPEEIVLNFKDVCFAYEQREVLHNINMQIKKKDMVAVVGPNGGGKSTLLKLALGIIRPIRGEVELFGKPINGQITRTGYVPQSLMYDDSFPVNVMDVVLMGRAERHVCGLYNRADRAAAMQALEEVDLAPLARRSFSQLSGGEKQRAMIAQALASEPEIIFLDEPTANVDSIVENKIYDLLAELNQRITIVVVSHNLNVVTRYASHLACINHVLSYMDMTQMPPDILQSIYHGNMLVLQHNASCPIIDPNEKLNTSHLGQLSARRKR